LHCPLLIFQMTSDLKMSCLLTLKWCHWFIFGAQVIVKMHSWFLLLLKVAILNHQFQIPPSDFSVVRASHFLVMDSFFAQAWWFWLQNYL
jgi:hypothetical protein